MCTGPATLRTCRIHIMTAIPALESSPGAVEIGLIDPWYLKTLGQVEYVFNTRAFRRTFTPGPGKTPVTTHILIAADDEYTLYVNDVLVGVGSNFKVAQQHTVNLAAAAAVVLAVLARTTGRCPTMQDSSFQRRLRWRPRGGRTAPRPCSFFDLFWKSTTGAIPVEFKQPGFDDSTWPGVRLVWGRIVGSNHHRGPRGSS
ncbi:hypothetical protein DFH09DRAFT_1477301 [Mycena vulgaris]|nr:hypothetical protein DFH09DRAFT_1477301 [Mycena vulgaris]